jgi:hypothetical protein
LGNDGILLSGPGFGKDIPRMLLQDKVIVEL